MRILLVIATLSALEMTALAQPTAEDLYAQGQAAYDAGDYATAIGKWQTAHDLSKEDALYFNLAQAHRLSGDCAIAIATYRRFLATDVDLASEQHKLASDLVRELEPACKARDVDPKPALGNGLHLGPSLNDTAYKQRPGRTLRIAGIATTGVGAAMLVTGLVLGTRASAIGDEITTTCAAGCTWEQQKTIEARGQRYAKIGYALDVVGVAAISGGIVMYYLGHQSPVTLTPASGKTGVVLSWSGAW